MFENLRNAFREAIDNFQQEIDRDRLPESVSELLHWMEDEIVDVRVRVRSLTDERATVLTELESETAAAETCRRRGTMAAKIDDDETMLLAAKHAEKHELRAEVLRKKADALNAEIDLGTKEAKDMIEALKEAKGNRSGLAARLGRARAGETVRSADTLFDQMDQIDEDLSAQDRETDAILELDAEFSSGTTTYPQNDRRGLTDAEADAALQELKRRMGR